MNRRTSIKGLVAFLAVGVSSLSVYEWFKFKSAPADRQLLEKKGLIAELAEVIIPRTDTPGAKDAEVEEFILKIILFCSDIKTQNNFFDGLIDLETYTEKQYNGTFVECTKTERIAILTHFEKESTAVGGVLGKIKKKLLGKPFFTILKELTVEGYCTSEIGATKGLLFDYIPGTFEACIPLTIGQKSWATK